MSLLKRKSASYPSIDILTTTSNYSLSRQSDLDITNGTILKALRNQNIDAELDSEKSAPRFDQFIYRLINGSDVPDFNKLERAIAQELDSSYVRLTGDRRINGRLTIEIGQLRPCKISLKEALESQEFTATGAALAIPVGLDVDGKFVVADLHKLPHVMVGGQTGSGKSQFTENILIPSLLMRHSAESLKLLLIDPKMIQFTVYNGLPHLLRPVIVDADESKKAFTWLLGEMDERFDRLSKSRNQTIDIYNAKSTDKMPYIVVVIDEVADLMMVDSDFYESAFVSILQKGRAVGIHLYIGTSRPSEEVYPETLRANFVSRIAFTTASDIDSENIVFFKGAERLLGLGDLLFSSLDHAFLTHLQAPFATEEEVANIVEFWKSSV